MKRKAEEKDTGNKEVKSEMSIKGTLKKPHNACGQEGRTLRKVQEKAGALKRLGNKGQNYFCQLQ